MEIELKYTDGDGTQSRFVIGSLELIEFINEIEFMQRCYQNGSITRAEQTRDELSEKLDDLMRLTP